MKTGSLINEIYATAKNPEPVIGMAATILSYSDRFPATVVGTFMVGRRLYVNVTYDGYIRVDNNGMSDCQNYTYVSNMDAKPFTYRLEKDGSWISVYKNDNGRLVRGYGYLRLGHRERYYDYSF